MPPGETNDFGGLPLSWLLRRHREAAFEDFVRLHYLWLRNHAMWRVRNYHDAEEIAWETCERARRKWKDFRGESDPTTWLRKICENLCIDHWRSKRLDCVSLDELLSKSPGADQQISQLAAAEPEQEALLDLWQAIPNLPEKERWAFVLTKLCGYSVTEAAEIYGVPRTTLDHRLKTACRHLAAESEPPSRKGT